MKYDCVVVGAGFAGATIAERLADSGKSVLVIEQRDHVGGNCYDYKDENGITIQKYGPHIFHTNNKEVWDYLSQFTEWIPYKHKVLSNQGDKTVSLPVSLKTIDELFLGTKGDSIKKKLIEYYGSNKKITIIELLENKDTELNDFAEEIFEKIYLGYSRKQWGEDPRNLNSLVLNRVPVWTNYDDSYFKDSFQGIPKDGFTQIVVNMLNKPNIKLILKKSFKEIAGEIEYEKLFFTGSIDEYFGYKHGKLPYRAQRFEFETLAFEWFQSNSVVNYPGIEAFTRITEFKHFDNHKADKTVILKEYSENYEVGKNIPSYPIPKVQNQTLYEKYKQEADKLDNVVFLGRLGEYKYCNMDEVVANSLNGWGVK